MTAIRDAVEKSKLEKIDISSAVALVTATKEESEINTIKKACQVTLEIYSKYLKEQLMISLTMTRRLSTKNWLKGLKRQ